MDLIILKWICLLILVVVNFLISYVHTERAAGLSCQNDFSIEVINQTQRAALIRQQYTSQDFEPVNSTHFRYCRQVVAKILHKCCPRGEAYNGEKCVPYSKPLTINLYDSNLRRVSTNSDFITGKNFCSGGKLYYDSGEERSNKSFYVLENSFLYLPKEEGYLTYDADEFCLDNLLRKDFTISGSVVCFTPKFKAKELKCHPALTINVTGRIDSNGDLVTDFTYTPDYYTQINATHFQVCVCSVRSCLRKCCPIGMRYTNSSKCATADGDLTAPIYDKNLKKVTNHPEEKFYVIYGNTCSGKKYPLEPEEHAEDVNYLLENGLLYMPELDRNHTILDFCVENRGVNEIEDLVFLCFSDPALVQEEDIYPIGFLVSLPFLIVTLLVYALLPELRSLHGKNLMCHISSLIVAYVFLSSVQLLGKNINEDYCVAAAYIVQFSFLATFFWLNVMSFDIWLAFSNFRPSGGNRGDGRYAFLIYSAYAWGSPLIMLIVSMALDLSPNVPDSVIKPGFGKNKCWFETHNANLAYFYGPIAVILFCNCCLFAATAFQIFVVKRETKVLRASDSRTTTEDNKQRFCMYFKLFLIMGVNWITEVISWAVGGPKEVWYVTDIANTLQGVLIFWIFIGSAARRRLLLTKIRDSRLSSSRRTTATTEISNRSSRR